MVTDRALVQYVDPKSKMAYRLETRLACVYTGDFEHGGRLYTRDVDGYQFEKEEDRACIHIDGEPTVELDFSGLHPRLLYSWEGIQYPADSDPYVVNGDVGLRDVYKNVFTALINSEPKRSRKTGRLLTGEQRAVAEVNKFLFDHRKHYLRVRRRGLNVKNDLVPAFVAAHPAIAKYFHTDAGMRAQNQDAKIALEVIEHFAADNVPILAIHDSFIVARQYERRLYKAMRLAYSRQTGGFTCPIK